MYASGVSHAWEEVERRAPSEALFADVAVLVLEVGLGDVQGGVDDLWNRFDFSAELILNAVQHESVIVGDEVDGDSEVSEAA